MTSQPHTNPIQADVEGRLVAAGPELAEVEVLLAEVVGGRRLRVFIDHPDGVTLARCEQVSLALNPLRERYSLEVSSPGAERPLTKPAHFRRFVGRRVRVRTRGPISRPTPSSASPEEVTRPVNSVTGELVAASESEVTLAAEGGLVTIPYEHIRRSNLLEE